MNTPFGYPVFNASNSPLSVQEVASLSQAPQAFNAAWNLAHSARSWFILPGSMLGVGDELVVCLCYPFGALDICVQTVPWPEWFTKMHPHLQSYAAGNAPIEVDNFWDGDICKKLAIKHADDRKGFLSAVAASIAAFAGNGRIPSRGGYALQHPSLPANGAFVPPPVTSAIGYGYFLKIAKLVALLSSSARGALLLDCAVHGQGGGGTVRLRALPRFRHRNQSCFTVSRENHLEQRLSNYVAGVLPNLVSMVVGRRYNGKLEFRPERRSTGDCECVRGKSLGGSAGTK